MTSEYFESINQSIRYTNWTALRRSSSAASRAGGASIGEFEIWLTDNDVTLRGAYDIRAFRGDADLLLWFHAPDAALIQEALRRFLKTETGVHFESTWSGMGIHRPAEFNRTHVPGFLSGKEAQDWICVYPFVRSYDWYLLPEADRSAMLIEHGKAGSKYKGIVSNTVASFALGDYEWLLALESNELHEIVDMMRDLRYTQARMHVREEVPFFTGRRIELTTIGELFS